MSGFFSKNSLLLSLFLLSAFVSLSLRAGRGVMQLLLAPNGHPDFAYGESTRNESRR